jgi:hypothetical protein
MGRGAISKKVGKIMTWRRARRVQGHLIAKLKYMSRVGTHLVNAFEGKLTIYSLAHQGGDVKVHRISTPMPDFPRIPPEP